MPSTTRLSITRRSRSLSVLVALSAVLAAMMPGSALAQGQKPLIDAAPAASSLPTGFSESTVFSGLDGPTVIQFAADGRVFVAEKSGIIKVFDNLTDTTPTVFADLRTNVYNAWDRGLLGMALAPTFPADPSVYVLYTYDHILGDSAPAPRWGTAGATSDGCPSPPGINTGGCVVSGRLSKLTANGNVSTGSEQVLIEDWCQQFPSHSIGGLAFGTDGALYVSGGDGANFDFVDYGQVGDPYYPGGNPCGDPGPHAPGGLLSPPAAEGGALRSQDLQTAGSPGGSSYSTLVLNGNPAGYWRFGEASGTTLVDSAGANTGTYAGGFTLGRPGALTGDANTAVAFNGSTGSASVPDAAALDMADGPFSIEFWLKLASTSGAQAIVDKGAYGYYIGIVNGRMSFYRSSVGPLITTETGVADTNWHHWIVTRNGTSAQIYKDGVNVTGTVASIYPMQSTANPLLIGTDITGSERLNGTLDELAIYPRVLTAQEAADHYAAGITGTGGTTDPTGLDGAILRVDPATGLAMPTNPNFASSDPNARRIIAYGLRNPFRFALRPGTNELWIGDVGWTTWEEINRIADTSDAVVENFGWPCYEGVGRQASYDSTDLTICENLYSSGGVTAPVYTYNHGAQVVSGESCPVGSSAIAGMAFYPEAGGTFPSAYQGALFFADHARNCIWVMTKGGNGQIDPTSRAVFAAGAANPVDLKVGPGGDLFYVDFDGGTIRRIHATAANLPPTAVIETDITSGPAPLTVQFSGTGSSDPEGGALTYAWDFTDDGVTDATTPTAAFTYQQAGTYTARLTVRDPQNQAGTTTVQITAGVSANSPPVPVIATPTSQTTWAVGDLIDFSGSATDPEDGALPASSLSWALVLQHCPSNCHAHPLTGWDGVSSGSFNAPDHEYPSYLELTLTATDSQNLSASTTVRLDPKTVQLTMSSSPSGLQLSINGVAQTAPFTVTVIQGSNNTISAPTPQDLGGARYTFDHWSDGGVQSHNITAGTSNATYTATYLASSADLAIVKAGTPDASTQRIAYSLAVTNSGPGPATSVTVSDVIERGQTYVSASTSQGSCAHDAATFTLTCALGTLASGQAVTVTLVVSVDRWKGWASNTATVASVTTDLDLTNNTSTVRIRAR